MKASEVVGQIKAAVDEFAQTGNSAIPVQNMQMYLDGLLKTTQERESSNAPISEAQAQHQLEIWKTQLVARSGMTVEMFKAVVEAGQTALKSATLLNGGAAVAMLAFVGNALTNLREPVRTTLLTSVGGALFIFMIGAGLSGVSTAARYLSQACYANAAEQNPAPYWMKWGMALQWASIALGVGSFASFFAGGWTAYRSIVRL
ncbi:hypothetical protein [Caballeronia sp. TF1N1]|uniref:hypothetical protein n=1 Tax=Caballeronia sp. TF1N1 TaxID=2878153 RepID=UPI001FD544E4|nr:hypothetical protein [Caballeronia sp. TF1N1]